MNKELKTLGIDLAKNIFQLHGANKAAVALANKNARIIWAIMATGACYQPELACAA